MQGYLNVLAELAKASENIRPLNVALLILQRQGLMTEDGTFPLINYHKKFAVLKSNLERLKFICAEMERLEIDIPFKKDVKNDKLAVEKRESGNAFYKLQQYKEALQSYTESIMVAESKEVISLAYANRSAALFQLELFNESLEEIDRAFKNGYPENLRPKLIIRQKNCLILNYQKQNNYEPIPKISDCEKNSNISSAKNCIKITKNEKYGRHVVATKNIEVGEVIAVEPMYAGSIDQKSMYIYCHHCLKLCYNPIPCNMCSKTLYCGETCKDGAFNSYHKYECGILLSLDSMDLDGSHYLAFKITLMARDEWNDEKYPSDQTYRSDRFKEIINLQTHVEEGNFGNLFAMTAGACGIYYLVKKYTNFFEEGGSVSEDRFMDTLLSVMLVNAVNAVELYEFAPGPFGTYNLNKIARGDYSLFSLFSHSCCPNIHRTFHGSVMVLRSNSTIKKGEQCFVQYYTCYAQCSKEDRQEHLRLSKFFNCTCDACRQNWPRSRNIPLGEEWSNEFAIMKELETIDASLPKKLLPRIVKKVKAAEARLSPPEAYLIKILLGRCLDFFGNIRRI